MNEQSDHLPEMEIWWIFEFIWENYFQKLNQRRPFLIFRKVNKNWKFIFLTCLEQISATRLDLVTADLPVNDGIHLKSW